jgi:acylphosphatase
VSGAVRLTGWLRGRVQGVGMRWWIRSRALELGLVGWARNLDDGRVEVVAEGPRSACEALWEQLQPGAAPGRPGRIESAVQRWTQETGLGAAERAGFVER